MREMVNKVKQALEMNRVLTSNNYPVPADELGRSGVQKTPGMEAFITDLARASESEPLSMAELLLSLADKGRRLTTGLKAMFGEDMQAVRQGVEKWGDPQDIVYGLGIYAQTKYGNKGADNVHDAYDIHVRAAEKRAAGK